MSKRVHIIIVEPSAVIRSGVVAILQQATSLHSDVAEMNDLASLLKSAHTDTPDVIIVNPLQIGASSPSQLKTDIGGDSVKVVALQSTLVDEHMLHGFDLVLSIFDTVESIIEKIEKIAQDGSEGESRKELSQREKEILVCVVKGLTNKQIADELFLSTHTIIAHRRNITNKLQIFSPSGLTIYAIVNKLVDLSEINRSGVVK